MAKQFTGTIVTIILQTYRLPLYSSLILSRIQPRCKLFRLCTPQTIRNFCSHTSSNDDTSDNKIIDKQCTLRKNHKLLTDALCNLLSINKAEALEMINEMAKIKSFNEVTDDDVISTVNIALKAGVSAPAIKKNISLLMKNRILLEKKFYCLNCLPENIDDLLPLVDTSINYLRRLIIFDIMEIEHGKHKFRYLADKLEVDMYRLCKEAANTPTVFIKPIDKIMEIMDALKEHNFDNESILSSLWLFRYSASTIHKRSFRVKQSGVEYVKPWMIRCSLNGLHSFLSVATKEQELEKLYGSHVNLISRKLQIPISEVEFFLKRSPDLIEIHLDKISQVLDILLKYKYSAVEILSNQRIFLIKAEILENRLEQLYKLRGNHRLTLVYCSNKIFETNLKRKTIIYKQKNNSNGI